MKPNVFLPADNLLTDYMEASAARHRHLCPRQVLGIRMGLYGLRCLGLVNLDFKTPYDNRRKRLLTVVETDGCGADGVAVATDCYVGRRTLRVLDFGKMAATMVDIQTGKAVRVVPHQESRQLARVHVPDAHSRWHAYLEAYQIIPDELLLTAREVLLTQSIAEILSRPTARAECDDCGEEIINQREIKQDGRILCRTCAGDSYYCEL
mgnify:CR=1 FL=1